MRRISWNFVVAAGYIAAGLIAKLVAIPPADVTVFWPSAGIAMASVYIFGAGVLPGVFIGSVLLSPLGFYNAAELTSNLPLLATIFALAAGSALQALAGAWCMACSDRVRDDKVLGTRDTLGLALSVALACLISSSIGAGSLFLSGALPAERILLAWATWWLGDLVGIVLIVPIIVTMVWQSRPNSGVLILVMTLCITAVHVTSTAVRESAAENWRKQAAQTASRLTSTALLWIDLSTAPISSLAVLFQNSDYIDDIEFFDAVAALEDNNSDFFPDSLAFTVSLAAEEQNVDSLIDDLMSGNGRWEIVYATDLQGQLNQGADVASEQDFARAIAAAIHNPGKVVIGAFTTDETGSKAIAAISVEHAGRPSAIIGMINFGDLLKGLFELQVPDGTSLRLHGKGAGAAFDAAPVHIFGDHMQLEGNLATENQRAISSAANLDFRWYFSDSFLGGPGSSLADGIFIAGILGTTGIVLFLGFLLRQNRRIREEVRTRTAELADREKILRSAMDNMSDGMFMLDEHMRFMAFNKRYQEYMGFPDALVGLGKSVEDTIRVHAARGDYGEGNPEDNFLERLRALASSKTVEREMRLADGSRILQLRKSPIDGGGAVVIVTDITEMSRARDKLRQSERESRLTLDNMPGGICMLDSDLRIQVVNRTYCDLYGNDPETYRIGRPISEIIRQNAEAGIHSVGEHVCESVDETVHLRIAALQSGVAGETERQLPNGQTLLVKHNPIEGGGVVLVATDITERKKAENRLRSIIETASDGIVVIDSAGKVMTFSPSAEKIFGYAATDVIGKNIRMLMPEPDRSAHDGYLRRYLDAGVKRIVGSNREVTGLRKDGESFAMDLAIGEATLGDETIFTGIIRNITERKKAQDTIRRQERQVRAIIDNIPLVIILKDSEGKHLAVNNYYETATGVPPDNVIGLRDDEFLPDEVAGKIIEIDQRIITTKSAETFEEQIPNPDGTLHDFLTTKVPVLDAEGNTETLVIAALDITERKVSERKLTEAYEVISSSIQYASRIQQAVLTGREMLTATMKESFSLWAPRDVVGGDIFWCQPWGNNGILIITADCTGHGVPGAFMTLIAAGALDRAVADTKPGSLGRLVRQLHLNIQISLNQQGGAGESDDGLELSAVYIDISESSLIFSGARLPLYMVENGEVTEFKATRSGIGYRGIPSTQQFEETVLTLNGNQAFYMATDGYIDQIGGERRRMLGKSRLKETLLSVQGLPFEEQKHRINQALIDYQGDESRRDDVTVLGFRP